MLYRAANSAFSAKFHPFIPGRLAVATSQNYGVVGNGQVLILQAGPSGFELVACYDTSDVSLDCAWCEENEHVVASASGDGSIKLWDVQANYGVPIRSLEEHTHEVSCVDWNCKATDRFLSASWDDSIKLWSANAPGSLATFARHQYCVYSVKWNPQHADIFLSASGDNTAVVWDARQSNPSLVLKAHARELLCADWCKYNDCIIATGSIDKSIKVWDVRAPDQPLTMLLGHSYPVRKLAFSPHSETVLASASYDMTVRLWDIAAPEDALLATWDHHTEFVLGVDWDVLAEGMLASCGWDMCIYTWHQNGDPRA